MLSKKYLIGAGLYLGNTIVAFTSTSSVVVAEEDISQVRNPLTQMYWIGHAHNIIEETKHKVATGEIKDAPWFINIKYDKSIKKVIGKAIGDCVSNQGEFKNKKENDPIEFERTIPAKYERKHWNAVVLYNYINRRIRFNKYGILRVGIDKEGRKINLKILKDYSSLSDCMKSIKDVLTTHYISKYNLDKEYIEARLDTSIKDITKYIKVLDIDDELHGLMLEGLRNDIKWFPEGEHVYTAPVTKSNKTTALKKQFMYITENGRPLIIDLLKSIEETILSNDQPYNENDRIWQKCFKVAINKVSDFIESKTKGYKQKINSLLNSELIQFERETPALQDVKEATRKSTDEQLALFIVVRLIQQLGLTETIKPNEYMEQDDIKGYNSWIKGKWVKKFLPRHSISEDRIELLKDDNKAMSDFTDLAKTYLGFRNELRNAMTIIHTLTEQFESEYNINALPKYDATVIKRFDKLMNLYFYTTKAQRLQITPIMEIRRNRISIPYVKFYDESGLRLIKKLDDKPEIKELIKTLYGSLVTFS